MQVEMANTAYSRSVADMASAGLSPALAHGGKPAATPNLEAPGKHVDIGQFADIALKLAAAKKADQDTQNLKQEHDNIAELHPVTLADKKIDLWIKDATKFAAVRRFNMEIQKIGVDTALARANKMLTDEKINLTKWDTKIKVVAAQVAKAYAMDEKAAEVWVKEVTAQSMEYNSGWYKEAGMPVSLTGQLDAVSRNILILGTTLEKIIDATKSNTRNRERKAQEHTDALRKTWKDLQGW